MFINKYKNFKDNTYVFIDYNTVQNIFGQSIQVEAFSLLTLLFLENPQAGLFISN